MWLLALAVAVMPSSEAVVIDLAGHGVNQAAPPSPALARSPSAAPAAPPFAALAPAPAFAPIFAPAPAFAPIFAPAPAGGPAYSPAPGPAPGPAPAPAPAGAAPGIPKGLEPPQVNAEWDTSLGTAAWRDAAVNHSAIPPHLDDSMSEEAMDAAEPKFDDLDNLEHDGVATIHEVATFALKNGIPWSQAKVMFDVVDQNHDQRITRQEFHDSFPVSESVLEDLHTGFQAIDHDGDHMISHEEWIAYCNGWLVPKLQKATCEDLFATADTQEPKGFIDDAEFKAAGRRCKTVDDGNCSLLAISSRSGGQPHAAASKGLALLRGAKGQQLRFSGEQLFGMMMRDWKRRRTPGRGGERSTA